MKCLQLPICLQNILCTRAINPDWFQVDRSGAPDVLRAVLNSSIYKLLAAADAIDLSWKG